MSKPNLDDASARRAWRTYYAAAMQGKLTAGLGLTGELKVDRVRVKQATEHAAGIADLMLREEQARRR